MKTLTPLLLSAGLAFSLASCAQIKQSGSLAEEGHLRDAGFKLMLADRMDRQQMLNSLPADTLTRIQKDDNVYYVYADPDGCVCLYVGRDEEYQRLQQIAVEKQVSDQQMRVNDMAAEAQSGYGPGSYWNSWINNNPGRPDWDPH